MAEMKRSRVSGAILTDVRGADADRILFTGRSEDFDWITDAGCRAAADNPDNLFGGVLALLAECRAERHATISETRGASYAQLRAVSGALGMTPTQSEDWQLLAESLTLTERHVLCILGALAEAAA
jgi:hypothetical protein